MTPTSDGLLLAAGLFVGMVVLVEVGHRVALRRRSQVAEEENKGLGVIEAAVFSLLGLLIAFTFSGAATRFDGRRQLIIEEANNIGTAYLRIDLVPEQNQAELRGMFKQYLDSRLDTYRKLPDLDAAMAEMALSRKYQDEIWTYSVTACRDSGSQSCNMLLLPAINAMFDISTTRTEAAKIHPPSIIFAMIVLLSLAGSLLAGYGMSGKSRSWVHIVAFAAVMAITVYVIIDIEYPRYGLINVAGADKVLADIRASMK